MKTLQGENPETPKRRTNENLKTLKGKTRLQYIWDYYKLPLAVLCIVLYVLVYILYSNLTHRESVLYTALVNVNAGETLTEALSSGFLDYMNLNPSRNQSELYAGLYLTDDALSENHQYTYASRMKILAMIDGELLDVILMNREAFDAFSQNGYLYDLEELLSQTDSGLYDTIRPDLVANIVILEDNQEDLLFDTSASYHAVTEEHNYGIDLSQTRLIGSAGFGEPVYFGIIANSPRTDIAVEYLKYLYDQKSSERNSP